MGMIGSNPTYQGDTQWGQCSLPYYKDKGWPVCGLLGQYVGMFCERSSTDNCQHEVKNFKDDSAENDRHYYCQQKQGGV